jgi:hypothetical protein
VRFWRAGADLNPAPALASARELWVKTRLRFGERWWSGTGYRT